MKGTFVDQLIVYTRNVRRERMIFARRQRQRCGLSFAASTLATLAIAAKRERSKPVELDFRQIRS